MEYRKEFETEDKSVKITLEIKAEHLTDDEKRKILGFIAQSSHRFYLETAEKMGGIYTERTASSDKTEAYEKRIPYQIYQDFYERERLLDGTCRNEIVSGRFTRHLMEKSGLLKYAGLTGKTRIVIEYNNDTGEGWRRIVTEDATTVATQTNR